MNTTVRVGRSEVFKEDDRHFLVSFVKGSYSSTIRQQSPPTLSVSRAIVGVTTFPRQATA